MAGKKEDKIIKYITALPAGTRISVRNVAKENCVSEGTAYKAIKYAESLNLVETKLRSGTVRLGDGNAAEAKNIVLSQIVRKLGLTVLCGERICGTAHIGSVIIGDGSVEQFKESLSEAEGDALCIIGDRPELFFHAVSKGINMIITGGIHPGEALLDAAAEKNICVLLSRQDSGTVFSLLHAETECEADFKSPDTAEKWMQVPSYLYYNDMVADWYKSYGSTFNMHSKHAVVDDSLHICGVVDAAQVMAASPSTKISNIYAKGESVCSADISTPMIDIANLILSKATSTVYITDKGSLCGTVTATDVIRYFLMSNSSGADSSLPDIEKINSGPAGDVYSAQLEKDCPNSIGMLMDIVNSSVKDFSANHPSDAGVTASGTFFATPIPQGEVQVSCRQRQTTPGGAIIEIEMYNESKNCANCMLVLNEDSSER